MLQLPGHHLGDCWCFVEDELCHLFFLVCATGVPRHVAWDIGHATSTDLVGWDYHGVVLRRGADDAWTASARRRDRS